MFYFFSSLFLFLNFFLYFPPRFSTCSIIFPLKTCKYGEKIAFSWHSKTYSGKFFSTVQMIHYCRADQPHWLKSTVLMQAIASVGPEFGQAFQPSAQDDHSPVIKIYYLYTGNCQRGAGVWSGFQPSAQDDHSPVIKIYYLYTGNCQRGAGVWSSLSTRGPRRPLPRH